MLIFESERIDLDYDFGFFHKRFSKQAICIGRRKKVWMKNINYFNTYRTPWLNLRTPNACKISPNACKISPNACKISPQYMQDILPTHARYPLNACKICPQCMQDTPLPLLQSPELFNNCIPLADCPHNAKLTFFIKKFHLLLTRETKFSGIPLSRNKKNLDRLFSCIPPQSRQLMHGHLCNSVLRKRIYDTGKF